MKLTNQKLIFLIVFSLFLILGIIILIKLLNIHKPRKTCTGTDCPKGKSCKDGNCVTCIPITICSTDGKCGENSDSCTGKCKCPSKQKCDGNNCVTCIPTKTCTGTDCSVGSDGCNGKCTCPNDQKCKNGKCYNPLIQNMFLAVGKPYTFNDPDNPQKQFTGTMATSNNGFNWVPIPDSSSATFSNFASGVECNGLIWVVVGSSNDFSIAWSPDGKTWVEADKSYTNIIFSEGGIRVKWNGNIWVAVGGGEYAIAWSLDGKYWNGVQDSRSIFMQGRGISWNGKLWIAVGSGTYSIATSQDGKSWTGVKDSGKLLSTANAIACNQTMCIAVGDISYGPIVTNNTIAYSLDGIKWTPTTNIFSNGICNDVLWNGSYWVAVGYGDNSIARSYDGIKWTPVSTYADLISIGCNENVFVISSSNTIAITTDLIHLRSIPNILTNGALGITWWGS